MRDDPLTRRHRLMRGVDEDSTTWPASVDADLALNARQHLLRVDARRRAEGAALLAEYTHPDDTSASQALRRLMEAIKERQWR